MPKEYPPEYFENKQEQARITLGILQEMPTNVFYHNVIIALADLLQRMVHESYRDDVFTKSHKSHLTSAPCDPALPVCPDCQEPAGQHKLSCPFSNTPGA